MDSKETLIPCKKGGHFSSYQHLSGDRVNFSEGEHATYQYDFAHPSTPIIFAIYSFTDIHDSASAKYITHYLRRLYKEEGGG